MDGQGFLPGVSAGGAGLEGINALNEGFIFTDVADFAKAVTAGYGSDVAALSGGGALRLQSIEATLLTTIERYDHFVLFNLLEKSNATATVDEYSVKNRIGGFPGSAFNSELGEIAESQGDYERRVLLMKYLMTQRQVSVVQKSQKTLVDTMADQNQDGTLELLRSAEWGLFYGDSACSSVEFDGIRAQMESDSATNNSDHIYDMRGRSISANAGEIIDGAAFISGFGNFGKLDTMIGSVAVQADLDQKLDPAHRVNLSGDPNLKIQYGTPVTGIRTSWGPIKTHNDIFIQEGQPPFEARGGAFSENVSSAGVVAPASIAGVAAANASSLFGASHAGLYYYAVEAVNKNGRSTLVKSAQVTVAAGDSVTLTITHAGASNATCFMVHRGRRNGTNATTDFREMIRIPKGAGATTTYVDHNQNIPGTSVVFLLSVNNKAIGIRRLLPLTRFPLYPTNKAVHPWALLMFIALRMGKINQHRILKNVLPDRQTWQPF